MLAIGVVVGLLIGQSGLTTGPVELVGEGYQFSEGPLWLPSGTWVFSDTTGNTIYATDGDVFRAESGGSNGLALDGSGGVVCCEGGARRVTRVDRAGKVTVLADSY